QTSLSTNTLPPGSHTIKATYSGDVNFLTSTFTLPVITIIDAAYVLNPTVSRALTVSGNSTVHIPGVLVVDSSSAQALTANGNSIVTASSIRVTGGVQKSGNVSFSPAPLTGQAPTADPLAGLASP